MRITNMILGVEGLITWLRLMIGKLSPAKAEGKQKLILCPSTLVISVNRPLLTFSVSQFFSIAMLWYFMITEYKRICYLIWQRLEYVGLIYKKKNIAHGFKINITEFSLVNFISWSLLFKYTCRITLHSKYFNMLSLLSHIISWFSRKF